MTKDRQQQFIAEIAPHAQEIQRQYGVPASIAIAQAALESGWGASTKGNNLYGIKAGNSWNGARIDVATHEFLNGMMRPVTDSFRAYASAKDSIWNYGRMLAGNARYAGVVQAGSANEAADELQRAGYATDPKYASKLKEIIASNDLTRFDDPTYRGYTEGDRFDRTRQRLNEQRTSNPGPWNDFMNFFGQLISAIFSGIGSVFSGRQIAENEGAPRTPISSKVAAVSFPTKPIATGFARG
jgi:hypothetical protein